ncbi:MAG: hypothetical protein H7125_06150 [Proteobacteria bacterium]|nr:hypothetical protein [Burkholderiales bacterium]
MNSTEAFSWQLRGRCYRLGDDVPHAGGVVPNWLISGRYMDPKDIVPHLFEETDPGFHQRCRAGDIIVTGRNFGMGPKMTGYIALRALDLGLVCETMPFLAYRAALGVGVRVLKGCPGVGDLCATGDELEVDFATGGFVNHTRSVTRAFPPLPHAVRDLVRLGGNGGWLRDWRMRQQGVASVATAVDRQ